jgi:hypothetical protein
MGVRSGRAVLRPVPYPPDLSRIPRGPHVVVGLPVEGRLRIVGRSTSLTAKTAGELVAYLHTPQSPHPWPEIITETMLNRFSKDKGPVSLTLVEPLVVEISANVSWTGNAFRHAIRYLDRGRSWIRRAWNCRAAKPGNCAAARQIPS